jgi:RND family efflux transporter MFP subunit
MDAHWAAFLAARTRAEFCGAWLSIMCRSVAGARAGILLLEEASGGFVPAAIWPDVATDMSHLLAISERALRERQGTIESSGSGTDQPAAQVAWPIEVDSRLYGVAALDLATGSEAALQQALRALHWGSAWLETLSYRVQLVEGSARSERAAIALQVVSVANEHERFEASAAAVVTELASRVGCERVMLGVVRRGSIRLTNMSHSAWFDRKSKLVAAAEHAMEEAMDQNGPVVFPDPGDTARISAAHADLATSLGPVALVSVVVPGRSGALGVLTFQRKDAIQVDVAFVALCETIAELLGPILSEKLVLQRWVAGRLRDQLADKWRALTGPRHPAFKLAVLLVVGVLLGLTLVEIPHRVAAKAVLEGAVLRAAVAPFDGYVTEAKVRPGDVVKQGDLLALLDDRDLRLERTKWASELEQASRKYQDALVKRDPTNARVLAAQMNQATAQLGLAEDHLQRTRVVAPFDGVVVSGDLSQLLGSPLERGKVLFEIAPLDLYRVILQVDERDIEFVHTGQAGNLALTGQASERLPFKIAKVTPISTPTDGRNYFRVEARLEQAPGTLRPGMEGVGKVETDKHSILWIVTRGFVDWLTLTLWRLLP